VEGDFTSLVMSFKIFKQSGYTLVEMLIVMFIVVILSTVMLVNYDQGEYRLALNRAVSKLAQDLRRAEGMAMAAKEIEGDVPIGGYGVHFAYVEPTSYIIFANKNVDSIYDDGIDVIIETVEMTDGAEIFSLIPGGPLDIIFLPPNPDVIMNPDPAIGEPAIITLKVSDLTASVSVNKIGLIKVD